MWCAVAVGALCWVVRGTRGLGGVFAQDFGLRGILTANKLSKFRVSELGSGAAGTIRAERARARRSGAEASRNPSCPAAFREARSASHRGSGGRPPGGYDEATPVLARGQGSPLSRGDVGSRTRVLRDLSKSSPSAACYVFLSPGDHAGNTPTGSVTV